jgi:glycosyltransferase involved in cell wall biosynthesis
MRPLSVLFAAERLLPARGGAELAALEWLGALATSHDVRACFVPDRHRAGFAAAPPGVTLEPVAAPSDAPGYWATRRRRREAVGSAVAESLARRPADVVVAQLHAAPGVVDAAHAAGTPAVLALPSYESLCKYAFDAGSRCRPATGCRGCPRAARLDAEEARELVLSRADHERALAAAVRLVAPSRTVADACAVWSGRRPEVIAPIVAAGSTQPRRPGGDVLLVATRWSENKGLLAALGRALAPRRVAVTADGLPGSARAALRRLENVRVVANAPMPELLRDARLLLVPSQLPESFGRVAFEGMAAGVPTLAAGVGGLREFVPAGQLVEPPGSVDAWTAAVRRLDEPAAWNAARAAGRAAARAVVADPPPGRWERILAEAAGA